MDPIWEIHPKKTRKAPLATTSFDAIFPPPEMTSTKLLYGR